MKPTRLGERGYLTEKEKMEKDKKKVNFLKLVTPRTAVLALIVIMASAYVYDVGLFKTLLGWLLGGIIVNLVGVIVLGQLIGNVMKNKDVTSMVDFFKKELPDVKELGKEGITLFREAIPYLKKILENQQNEEKPN